MTQKIDLKVEELEVIAAPKWSLTIGIEGVYTVTFVFK